MGINTAGRQVWLPPTQIQAKCISLPLGAEFTRTVVLLRPAQLQHLHSSSFSHNGRILFAGSIPGWLHGKVPLHPSPPPSSTTPTDQNFGMLPAEPWVGSSSITPERFTLAAVALARNSICYFDTQDSHCSKQGKVTGAEDCYTGYVTFAFAFFRPRFE